MSAPLGPRTFAAAGNGLLTLELQVFENATNLGQGWRDSPHAV
jgi:hypothetical protein